MFELTQFQVTKRRRTFDMPAHHVQYFRANGNYVDLFAQGEKFLHRITMSILEQGLPSTFLRIHRSWIVNVKFIKHVQYLCNNEYRFTFMDGTEVVSGRSFKPQIASFLNDSDDRERTLRVWAFSRQATAA